MLLEKIKTADIVLTQYIQFSIGKLSLKVYSQGSEFFVADMNDLNLNMTGNTRGEAKAYMRLHPMAMTVLKPGLRSHSIADFEVKGMMFEVKKAETFSAIFGTEFAANYYNLRVGCWEPLIEEWGIEVKAN